MFTNAFQMALISCYIIVLPILARSGAPINGLIPCSTDQVLQRELQRNPNLRAIMEKIEQHWRQNPNNGGHVRNSKGLQEKDTANPNYGQHVGIGNRRRLQATDPPTVDPTDMPHTDPTRYPQRTPTPPTTTTNSPTSLPTTLAPTPSPITPYTLPIPLEIPINFHIVSNNKIGYEQIISQIRVLNLDFNKLNSDITQGEFASRVGNYNLKYSLNNIYRVSTSKTFTDNDQMKFSTSGGSDTVNPEYIFNLWVCNLGTDLGYAYLPGIEWDRDGIVINQNAFGSISYHHQGTPWTLDAKYNLGRTTTHEVGHWLNLRHIWGDGGCTSSKDDDVSDTPKDEGPNSGCPNPGISSCGSNDMYMNFMDYTEDNCVNMFTVGQVDRSDDLFLAGGYRQTMVDYYHNPTDYTFVSYFYFVYESAQCDVGHTRRGLDTNDGAPGDAVYLCIAYSNNPHMDVITDVSVVSADRRASTVEFLLQTSCPSGYIKIDTDLNNGNHGGDYMFVCFKKEAQSSAVTRIISDLNVFKFDNAYSGETQGYTLDIHNLNKDVGSHLPISPGDFPYIYLGYKEIHSLYSVYWGLADEEPCNGIRDKSTCLSSKDGRYHRLHEPCVWCGNEPCTTYNNNECEPIEWLFANTNVQLNNDKYEFASSGLIPVDGCWQITDKVTCLSSKDSRNHRLNEPCVWCNGPCTGDNNNQCEPAGWLFTRTNQINPGQYEVAVNGYFLLQNRLSTKCMYSSADGRFSYSTCVNTYRDQMWAKDNLNGIYFRVKNYHSGKCLVNRVHNNVIYTTSPEDHSSQVFHDASCTNDDNQKWYMYGNFQATYFMIRNKETDLCIYQSPDGRFGIAPCNLDNKDQYWRAIPHGRTEAEIPPIGDIPFIKRWSNMFSKRPNTSGSETLLLL
eukprot:543852_1